jgi:hypothetical protein
MKRIVTKMAPNVTAGPVRRTAIVATVVLLGVVTSSSTASAHLGWHRDGDDAVGRLDFRSARLTFESTERTYTWAFRTWESFNLRRNGGAVTLHVDSVGGRRWDYLLYLHYDGGTICDAGMRMGAGNIQKFSPLIWGKEARFGWCRFKGINKNKPIRWRLTSYSSTISPHNVVDRAPSGGWH